MFFNEVGPYFNRFQNLLLHRLASLLLLAYLRFLYINTIKKLNINRGIYHLTKINVRYEGGQPRLLINEIQRVMGTSLKHLGNSIAIAQVDIYLGPLCVNFRYLNLY